MQGPQKVGLELPDPATGLCTQWRIITQASELEILPLQQHDGARAYRGSEPAERDKHGLTRVGYKTQNRRARGKEERDDQTLHYGEHTPVAGGEVGGGGAGMGTEVAPVFTSPGTAERLSRRTVRLKLPHGRLRNGDK